MVYLLVEASEFSAANNYPGVTVIVLPRAEDNATHSTLVFAANAGAELSAFKSKVVLICRLVCDVTYYW